MELRRLVGMVIGSVGLAAGIAAVAVSSGALGAVAGVAAFVAGMLAFGASSASSQRADRLRSVDSELTILQHRTAELEASLADERAQHHQTRLSLDEYMAEHPAAGSFDRKLNDTGEMPVTGGLFGVGASDQSAKDSQLLADPETNLFSEAYFRVALDARIASARRHLRPVAVALLDVVEGDGGPNSTAADAAAVTAAIRQTLRDADTACRMVDGAFALILEDTPENGAVWTVERIRRNLASRFGQHTMWAGVACYPAHAFSTDEILDQATAALEAAKEWKQDRIEVATAD